MDGVRRVVYAPPRAASSGTHHYVQSYESSILYGQKVARECLQLRREGFLPDVIVAHSGWGEALFVKDVFPRATLLNYCEFYYHGRGADVGFDPAAPADIDTICRTRARNAHLLLSLEACDHGISPTVWQRDQHPEALRQKISVVFDGIDIDLVRPNATAQFTLPDGRVLTRDDEIVTYVARNLEPYRGFPSFMRSLPSLLAYRPQAQVLIAGGDDISYGHPPPRGRNWREAMIEEVGELDTSRVHFLLQLSFLIRLPTHALDVTVFRMTDVGGSRRCVGVAR